MKLRNDAKIKYHVGAHRSCSAYPDECDVIFDIASYIMSCNKRKKSWKPDDFRMNVDDMKNVFPDIGDDTFKEKIKTILLALHKNNDIGTVQSEDGKNVMMITKQGLLKLYEL